MRPVPAILLRVEEAPEVSGIRMDQSPLYTLNRPWKFPCGRLGGISNSRKRVLVRLMTLSVVAASCARSGRSGTPKAAHSHLLRLKRIGATYSGGKVRSSPG